MLVGFRGVLDLLFQVMRNQSQVDSPNSPLRNGYHPSQMHSLRRPGERFQEATVGAASCFDARAGGAGHGLACLRCQQNSGIGEKGSTTKAVPLGDSEPRLERPENRLARFREYGSSFPTSDAREACQTVFVKVRKPRDCQMRIIVSEMARAGGMAIPSPRSSRSR